MSYYPRNESHFIFETYRKKVCADEKRDKLLSASSENIGIFSPNVDLEAFERHLNQSLPKFERDMYDKVSVETSDKDQINIFLHEKSGEKINLNMTSAGRRWYFTYYFMKNTLEKDDLFIIDEPAGMLHPLAQKEVLKELLDLAKQGIKVIYSTHSPYLIPDEWKCVHFVSMGDNGTKLYPVEDEKEVFKQMKNISGNDIFNLEQIYDIYNKSDREKLANNCYRILIEYFETTEKAAAELSLSEDTIISWRKEHKSKKFRSPKLENVFLIAAKTQRNIMDLFQF